MNDLENREFNGGQVSGSFNSGYELLLPEHTKTQYRLAQVDDYMHLPRRKVPYQPPVRLRLEARISDTDVQGTWGFGLWNDPFSLGFGAGGMARLLPVPPNAAWFFYASDENHLSLRDDQPGSGFHVKTYRSPLLPSFLSVLAVPAVPLLLWQSTVRFVRKILRSVVKEDCKSLQISMEDWHTYSIIWQTDQVLFEVDSTKVFQTGVSPLGRMGLVMWIDNQYFLFDPEGNLGFGFLSTPSPVRLQIRNISVTV